MKIKTSELTGPALDWAVAKITNPQWWDDGYMEGDPHAALDMDDGTTYSPSTNWAQGGPIIEREKITVGPCYNNLWWAGQCDVADDDFDNGRDGPTPLIAAMRCYVASKLGDEVDVPNELLTKSDIIRALHPDATELKITPANPADFTGFPTLEP